MDKHKVTPKDFFLWAGAMVSLYASVFAFISILFDYIDKVFPKPVTDSYSYYDPYLGSTSVEIATLIVLTPVFMAIMRAIRRDIAGDHSRAETWVRRWALVLTLFVAGATMVVDLIVLLTTFLQGEAMTLGFLLKVLVVLLVAGAGFLHFLADMRGYWERNASKASMINWAVGVLVLATIVSGFFIIGTPQELRRLKQDNTRIQDLQNIQWQIINYWQSKESLPASLEELRDPISDSYIPSDPKTGEAYRYTRTSPLDFALCATFEAAGGTRSSHSIARPTVDPMEDNWQHEAGEVCFDRSIDPERYPAFEKTR